MSMSIINLYSASPRMPLMRCSDKYGLVTCNYACIQWWIGSNSESLVQWPLHNEYRKPQ